MSRRWVILFIALWIAVAALWFGLPRLLRRAETAADPVPTAIALTATETETSPSPTPEPPTSTPIRIEIEQTPTAIPTPQPTPTSTPSPNLTPEPSPTPQPAQTALVEGRVDRAGPIPLPTVQPLPFGDGLPPVRLLIPALNLDTAVEPMGWHEVEDANGRRSEWDVIDFAAGHHINTAYAGEAGNVVLSGHNNIGGSVFRSLCVIGEPGVALGLGDEMILIDEAGGRFTYQINGWRRMAEANASIAVQQENARWMDPTEHAQLTLVTCWPPWSNTHRVVVTGVLTGR